MFEYHWISETNTYTIFSYHKMDTYYLQIHYHQDDEKTWCEIKTNINDREHGDKFLGWFSINCHIYDIPSPIKTYIHERSLQQMI